MKAPTCGICVLSIVAALFAACGARASTSDEVLALTSGSRAKFVWLSGWDWHLKTFDTDGGTIQEICHKGTAGSAYGRPLITADGEKILYLNQDNESSPQTHVVNFDGTGDSVLLTDVWLSDVWRDPATQKDYVIGVVGSKTGDVYKIDMENTFSRTLIWDKTPLYVPSGHDEIIEWGWLTISPDGDYICSAFPFMGGCGVGVVKTIDAAQTNYFRGDGNNHEGCWTCIVPDGTHRYMTMDYAHDTWWLNTVPKTTEVNVEFGGVPDPENDNDNDNVYFPQFTNDPQFMVCTENYDDGNYKHAYFAKMSASLDAVTDWVVLCDQSSPVWNIDGWVDPGTSPTIDPAMSFSPISLNFTAELGAGNPSPQTITLTNGGGGTLEAVTVSGEPAWLVVNRTGSDDLQYLENVVDASGLAAGPRSATITVACANAEYTTKTYTVNLTITQPGRDPDAPVGTIPGLIVAYYETTGGSLPVSFAALTPYMRRLTTAPIEYPSSSGEFASSGRTDGVSALFEGFIEVPALGEYTFYLESDDGSALYIGATRVVDNDGSHAMQEHSGSIILKPGKHSFSVQYTEDASSAGLIARYEGPSIAKQVIPADAFSTNAMLIRLLSPNGGEIWYAGTTRYVQWTTVNVDNVQMHISTNGGGSWSFPEPASEFVTIPEAHPDWGYCPVVVPPTPSSDCLVKVSAYLGGQVPIESASAFEIRDVVDSDSDGMADAWELDHFGNLDNAGSDDGDADGLSDLDEYRAGSDPASADTDGDQMPDGWEVANGLNPAADDAELDPDGDGSTNIEEYANGTNPTGADADSSSDAACGAGGNPGSGIALLLLIVAALRCIQPAAKAATSRRSADPMVEGAAFQPITLSSHRSARLAVLMMAALMARGSSAAASDAKAIFPFDTYTQEIEVTFENRSDASRASPRIVGLYDGAQWAVSSRWDDNSVQDDLKMRDAMNSRGYKATFYLTQGMKPDDLKDLMAGGNSLAGHSLTHPWLPYQSRNRIFEEMAGIRLELEAASDSPVISFGFPFLATNEKKRGSDFGGEIGRMLERAGFYHVTEQSWLRWQLGEAILLSPWLPPDGGDVEGAITKSMSDNDYKQRHPVFSFAMHAGAFISPEKMSKLDGWMNTYGGKPDWWYCNQNQYAAYRYQFLHGRLDKLPTRGATARFRVTRPVLVDLGDPIPITIEMQGVEPSSVVKVSSPKARCEVSQTSGSALRIHVGHDADQHLPAKVGLVHNRNNSPRSSGTTDSDFPDIAAHLHFASGTLQLSVENRGRAMENVKTTYRLPIGFNEGVVRHEVAKIPRGRHQDVLTCTPSNSDYAYRCGSAFFVAQIDFSRGGTFGRLYATCNVDTTEADPAYPQGNFLRLGPIPEAKFDLGKVVAALASAKRENPSAFGADSSQEWVRTEGALASPWLDAEMVRTEGRWYSPAGGAYFILRSTVASGRAQAVKLECNTETIVHAFLNGAEVKGEGRLKSGKNMLALVYRLPNGSTHPERGGCFLRLTDAGGRGRLASIRYEAE